MRIVILAAAFCLLFAGLVDTAVGMTVRPEAERRYHLSPGKRGTAVREPGGHAVAEKSVGPTQVSQGAVSKPDPATLKDTAMPSTYGGLRDASSRKVD